MLSRLFLFMLSGLALGAIHEQDGVWVLTDQNMKEALSKQNEILVFFYKADCAYCSKLSKPYSKAAKRLKDLVPPVHIAKVDADANPQLSSHYELKPSSFPFFLYITKEGSEEFPALRSEDGFFSWVAKKTGQPFTLVSDLNTLQLKIQKTNVAVVYFGDLDTKEYRVFSVVSKTVNDASFFVCPDMKARSFYSVLSPAAVVFKQFDDKRADFEGSFLTKELVAFVEKHKSPWIVEFDEAVDDYIYMKKKVCLLLLRHDTEGRVYDKILRKISRQLEGKLVFSYLDVSPEGRRKLASTFGVQGKKQPLALILDPANDLRYLYEGIISEESLKSFLKDWKSGKLTPFVRSQEVPEKALEKNVKVLVGKTFESVAFDKDLDVLVMFYSESSEDSKKFMGKYEKIAEKLKDNQKVSICKIDVGSNEIRAIKIEKVPGFWVFPAGGKKAVEYKGKLDEQELMSFFKKLSVGNWVSKDL